MNPDATVALIGGTWAVLYFIGCVVREWRGGSS